MRVRNYLLVELSDGRFTQPPHWDDLVELILGHLGLEHDNLPLNGYVIGPACYLYTRNNNWAKTWGVSPEGLE